MNSLITFHATNYHNGSNADKLESLLDNDLRSKTIYGVIISRNVNSWFKFNLSKKSKILAYSGGGYNDSGGSTPGKINLYKLNNDGKYEKIIDNLQTKTGTWYTLIEKAYSGEYQIKNEYPSGYVNFTEWQIIPSKCILIKQGNQFYTIKQEFYNYGLFKPITFSGRINPNAEDFDIYGMDSENELCSNFNVGSESFLPIDKLDDGFKIVKMI